MTKVIFFGIIIIYIDTFELFIKTGDKTNSNHDTGARDFISKNYDSQSLKIKEEQWIKEVMKRQLYKIAQKNEIKKQQQNIEKLNKFKNNPKFSDFIIEDPDIETKNDFGCSKIPSRIFPPLNKSMYGGLGRK